MSFNPAHDTPEVMRLYGQGLEPKAPDWRFLTAASPVALRPLLAAYDQSISIDYDAQGRPLGTFSHLLRVYLIDPNKRVRNVYSVSFLHPDLLAADIPEQGFTSNELATAVGIEGRTVRRNAPTILNSAYLTRLFHDGREYSLEQQIRGLLLARNEMANPAVGTVVRKLEEVPDYHGPFAAAFGGRGPSLETVGQALASYQRTLVSGDSPFDRWSYGGDGTALGEAAQRGFRLFTGKAGCAACHTIGPVYALFTDNTLHNTGIGYGESIAGEPPSRKVTVAPGLVVDVSTAVIDAVSEQASDDLGLYEVTQDPDDRWTYRTPTLRNVALTAPYMHNGSLPTLDAVVAFYDAGGVPNEVLDPLVCPLGLGTAERTDLVAFLRSLTGANIDLLIADAFAAPIGDSGESGQRGPSTR